LQVMRNREISGRGAPLRENGHAARKVPRRQERWTPPLVAIARLPCSSIFRVENPQH
jgi:hypothetical protein